MNNPNSRTLCFCPSCGEKKFDAVCRKSFKCSACGFNLYLNCAAAAIGLIFNPTGKLLVTRRKYQPAKEMLDFPGGFANPGETIEACLIREVKEELNLDVIDTRYICSLPNTYPFKDIAYDITDFVFICNIADFDHIQPADDVCDVLFALPGHLDKNDFGLLSAKKVVEMIVSDDFQKIKKF